MSLNEFCTIVKDYILKSHGINNLIAWQETRYYNPDIFRGHSIPDLESVNINDKNLLSYIQNFFTERIPTIRIKRDDNKNNILLSKPTIPKPFSQDKLLLLYKDKENNPNIIFIYKNTKGSSLFNYSLKHRQNSNPEFDIMEERIDLESLYFKAVFSIVMGLSKDDNSLKLLKEDVKFMDTLSELKEKFNDGLELLAK